MYTSAGRPTSTSRGLLRCHVGRTSEQVTLPRAPHVGVGAGQTEIGDLHRAVRIEHQVLGLQVTVQHATVVHELHAGTRRHHRTTGRLGCHLAAPVRVGERTTIEVLHHQQQQSVVIDEVVHLHDMRMREVGNHLRLPQERGPVRRVVRERGVELFDRNHATQLAVTTLDHAPVRAATQFAAHVIRRSARSPHLRSSRCAPHPQADERSHLRHAQSDASKAARPKCRRVV